MNLEEFDLLSKPFRPPFIEQNLTASNIMLALNGYSRIAKKLEELVSAYAPAGDQYFSMLTGLQESIAAHMHDAIKPGMVEQPLLPVIANDYVVNWINEVERRIDNSQVRIRTAFTTYALAAFVYETRCLWGIDARLRNAYVQTFAVDLSVALESYGFWAAVTTRDMEGLDMLGTRQTVTEFIEEAQKRINVSLAAAGKSTAEMTNEMIAAKAEAKDVIGAARASLAEVISTVERIKVDVAGNDEKLKALTEGIGSTESMVSAFASAVREELKIDTTKKLWKQRARRSSMAFWISAVVIAAAVLAPPAWAIYHIETVLSFLKRVGDAATQGLPADATNTQLTAATISRLVVITAPLALYFWAVKLLVRFNTRSMLLMDDAQQRHTTMDTYFHLIERSAATTEERGLMLNALFRPLPGQGQDNVEPPNFMELVKRPE